VGKRRRECKGDIAVKILGFNYTVIVTKDIGITDNLGWCDTAGQKMYIKGSLSQQQSVVTVLHEIIEALNYHLQFSLEHRVIMGLEAGLYQVLTDNRVDLTPLTRKDEE
jgi:hypothetical protein